MFWLGLLPEAACVLSREGHVLGLNDLLAQSLGFEPEALQGQSFRELVCSPDRVRVDTELLNESQTSASICIGLRHRDGAQVTFHWRSRIEESTGNTVLLGRTGYSMDQLQNQLELQRLWLTKAEQMAGVGHWHLSLLDSALYWSPEIYNIHGLDPETFTPDLQNAIEAYHPEDRKSVIADVERCRDTGEPFESYSRLVRPDGSVRFVWSRGERWDGPDGSPIALFGVFTDLTERLEMSEQLEESEARYRSLYARTPALLYTVDAQGKFIEVSDMWAGKLGYERKDMLGRRAFDFLSPESQSLSSHIKNNYLRSGSCKNLPIRFVKSSGESLDVLLSAVSENDASGGVLRSHVACVDVTHQKMVEKALEDSHLLILRKNQELKELAVAASHDLKAPVRNIQMFASLAQENCNEECREFLAYISEAGKRLQTIVSDLSRYMALEEDVLSFREVDLQELLQVVLRGLQSEVLASGATVEIGEMPTVVGSQKQLYSLFENVLSNALKFRGEEKPRITLECVSGENHWNFTLQDNGIGIREPFREEVFKLFRRLHSVDKFEGSGAGLALSKKVVLYHGGDIWFSPCDRGARLEFSLRKMVLDAL